MKGLVEGRIVHYVKENKLHRPAIIVAVFENKVVNLQIFGDSGVIDGNAFFGIEPQLQWRVNVPFDENEKLSNTWHWIERETEE